jgi:HD-GYP domain-containing protein (c-di-GMP phosphodiesterase class II)
MTSPRPYRPAATEREALRELSDKAGTQFDPDVVEALKQLLEGRGERVPPSGAADR